MSTSKQLTDRRESVESLIEFYETQARLAEMGLNTRRTPDFFRRQAQYFREVSR
jgi:hypothetical protein